MQKILVPTDFSPNADKALDYALHLAAATKASVVLVHVLGRTQSLDVEKLMLPYNVQSESIKLATSQLETRTTAATEMHVEIGWDIYNGEPADSIRQAVADINPDMIVMGTLGDSGTKEKFFGSITAKIIGHANIPVLAVPLLAEWGEMNHLLLSISHFKESEAHLKIPFELAKALNLPVHLSTFTDEDDDEAADYMQKKRDLEFYSQSFQKANPALKIIPTPIYGKAFEETLNNYITDNNSSILVMITHQRNFIDRILNPSLTRKMSYHTNIPLLSIPV